MSTVGTDPAARAVMDTLAEYAGMVERAGWDREAIRAGMLAAVVNYSERHVRLAVTAAWLSDCAKELAIAAAGSSETMN